MRVIFAGLAAVALATLSLSVPTSLIATDAQASKMNGKPYGAHAPTARAACFNGACRKKKR